MQAERVDIPVNLHGLFSETVATEKLKLSEQELKAKVCSFFRLNPSSNRHRLRKSEICYCALASQSSPMEISATF